MVAKAWADEAFKKRLLANPAEVLNENGVKVPRDKIVQVVEYSPQVVHFFLPEPPRDSFAQVMAKAWSDEAFNSALSSNPAAVLKENGIECSRIK